MAETYTRTLVFGAGESKKFARFVTMFNTGGNILHFNANTGVAASRSQEDSRKEAEIVRAYKKISDEVDENDKPVIGEGDRPDRRKLKPEGGSVTISQSAFTLLEKYLIAAPRNTSESDLAADMIDWVSLAKTNNPDPKE